MKFIEIKEGLHININSIEAIEATENEFKTKVITANNVFLTVLPAQSIINVLSHSEDDNQGNDKDSQVERVMSKLEGHLNQAGVPVP